MSATTQPRFPPRIPQVSFAQRPATETSQITQYPINDLIPSSSFPVPLLLPGIRSGGGKSTTSVSFSESQMPLWIQQPQSSKSYLQQPFQEAGGSFHSFPPPPIVPSFLGGGISHQNTLLNSAHSFFAAQAQQSQFFHRQPDLLEAIRAQYELNPALWTTLLDLKGSGRRKGGQIRFSTEQTQRLEATFEKSKYLTPQERKTIAKALDLSERQVKTWFQNRRAKWRRVKQDSPTGKYDVISSDSEDDKDAQHSFARRVLT